MLILYVYQIRIVGDAALSVPYNDHMKSYRTVSKLPTKGRNTRLCGATLFTKEGEAKGSPYKTSAAPNLLSTSVKYIGRSDVSSNRSPVMG